MNANYTRHVVVEPDGTGVVAHLGLHALGSFADRLGLGDSLSARIPVTGERLPIHDRGKVLAQLPTSIASGHRAGDDSALTSRSLVVRADSAGCTEGFLSACRARSVRFFVTARSNPRSLPPSAMPSASTRCGNRHAPNKMNCGTGPGSTPGRRPCAGHLPHSRSAHPSGPPTCGAHRRRVARVRRPARGLPAHRPHHMT